VKAVREQRDLGVDGCHRGFPPGFARIPACIGD